MFVFFFLEFNAIMLRCCVIFYLLRVGRCIPDNRVFAQIYRSRFETTGTHQLCVCVYDTRFARFIQSLTICRRHRRSFKHVLTR